MPKVDEIDFNGNSVAEETGQPEKTENKEETTEEPQAPVETNEEPKETEDVESLKERLAKLEEEKENYKKGMLKYKDLSLKKEEPKEEKDEEEYPDWDENSQKFQKQTLSKAEKLAEEKAQTIIESNNEKNAIAKFVEKHPDLSESDWNEIVSNYNPKNGKATVSDIAKDLERAFVLFQYEKGDKPDKKAETKLAEMSSVSKTTTKTSKEGNTLSKSAIQLAERMRVNPEKLALEDDSNTAVIKF